jgi:hypothetical protein
VDVSVSGFVVEGSRLLLTCTKGSLLYSGRRKNSPFLVEFFVWGGVVKIYTKVVMGPKVLSGGLDLLTNNA